MTSSFSEKEDIVFFFLFCVGLVLNEVQHRVQHRVQNRVRHRVHCECTSSAQSASSATSSATLSATSSASSATYRVQHQMHRVRHQLHRQLVLQCYKWRWYEMTSSFSEKEDIVFFFLFFVGLVLNEVQHR
ncbi:hypothetical protein, partial [Acinetobacter baumannii]|uniref:hypothetical protein n=1 Tax=Acinetobacter baumannii TaxID=470 RepID=UPI001C070961